MKPHFALTLLLSITAVPLAGCGDQVNTPREVAQGTPHPSDAGGRADDASSPNRASGNIAAPDNTARNQGDVGASALTPMDQSESGPDVEISAQVRRAILADSSMSVNGENVKIITSSGVVTLRGPVATDAERAAIEAKAKAVAGVTRVDNQLEVKAP